MRIELGHDEEPEIGLIALIDCIFFLLMFFMVATSFKQQDGQKKQKDIPILLPASQASLVKAEAAPTEPLVLMIDAQGGVYLDKQKLSLQTLHDRLRDEAAKNPTRPIRLDGDRRTPYQHIVHVLDLCQFEGLTQVSLRTQP
ncbi:ExbD/TolR family protein [Roseateles paludis]|jgi:biopolymer transport protein ExbD|uniref:Biopolymer transporter ExbD n=1 Tax=Roseateles paludis TaxID=3145238 RepID=A0ABV0FZ70_9BURK